MKKTIIFYVLFFAILGLCFGHNTGIEQQLLGTWIDDVGRPWIFSAKERLSFNGVDLKYVVANEKLGIMDNNNKFVIYNMSMSSDGKTLLLERSSIDPQTSRANSFVPIGVYWLIKE
jgi:hypothetical protein